MNPSDDINHQPENTLDYPGRRGCARPALFLVFIGAYVWIGIAAMIGWLW